MERTVIYRDRQELQSADLNNMQDFARTSMDHIVRDAVESGKAYSGFSATKTAATEITLSAGRLYAGARSMRAARTSSLISSTCCHL